MKRDIAKQTIVDQSIIQEIYNIGNDTLKVLESKIKSHAYKPILQKTHNTGSDDDSN